MIKKYYRLTKPGIIYGNVLMYTAGFFLASRGGVNLVFLIEGLVGLSLIIGSACVFNNIADRKLDRKMSRTARRSLATGEIPIMHAIVFASVLVLLGAGTLYHFSNLVALAAALFGFFVYVFLYTPLKPRTRYALFVGAVAGAMPPVVGYTMVSGMLDGWALGLFVALFVWQLPHFIAIATYRFEDYSMANVPLFARAPKNNKERKIARMIFVASLVVLLVGCLGIALWRLLTLSI